MRTWMLLGGWQKLFSPCRSPQIGWLLFGRKGFDPRPCLKPPTRKNLKQRDSCEVIKTRKHDPGFAIEGLQDQARLGWLIKSIAKPAKKINLIPFLFCRCTSAGCEALQALPSKSRMSFTHVWADRWPWCCLHHYVDCPTSQRCHLLELQQKRTMRHEFVEHSWADPWPWCCRHH